VELSFIGLKTFDNQMRQEAEVRHFEAKRFEFEKNKNLVGQAFWSVTMQIMQEDEFFLLCLYIETDARKH